MHHGKTALVTLTLGERYENMFSRYCLRQWQSYCHAHGYDLIRINKPLDTSVRACSRSPAWQKLLILSQDWSTTYDRVVWVDSDVIINPESPSIVSDVPVEKCGVVDSYAIPTPASYSKVLKRSYDHWRANNISFIDNSTPALYYLKRGIPGEHLAQVANTGVIVCSPSRHRALFEHVYHAYEDLHKTAEWNYEMPALSYEILSHDLAFWLPVEFNFCVGEIISAYYPFVFHSPSPSFRQRLVAKALRLAGYGRHGRQFTPLQSNCLLNIYQIGYFIHFAGCAGLMAGLPMQLDDSFVSAG